MRVAVLDDVGDIALGMTEVLRGLGHEVLVVVFSKNGDGRQDAIYTVDPHAAARAILEFDPDLVFWDHILGKELDFSGGTVAELSGVPAEKSIGTSTTPQWQYAYCRHVLAMEKDDLSVAAMGRQSTAARQAHSDLLADEITRIIERSDSTHLLRGF